jgi:hypothetical protein
MYYDVVPTLIFCSAEGDEGISPSPRRSTRRLLFPVLYVIILNVHRRYSVLIYCQLTVSGHGVQIKDTDGDEADGLDECSSLLCPLGEMPVTKGIPIGICAMDYRGDDPDPTADTRGLIVDDVSHREQLHIYLPTHTFASLGDA